LVSVATTQSSLQQTLKFFPDAASVFRGGSERKVMTQEEMHQLLSDLEKICNPSCVGADVDVGFGHTPLVTLPAACWAFMRAMLPVSGDLLLLGPGVGTFQKRSR
jgi:hypothetical protein